jgi:hypothetical protein
LTIRFNPKFVVAEMNLRYRKFRDFAIPGLGFDPQENIGRRNSLISWMQEHIYKEMFFNVGYKDVIHSGRSGEPDFVIGDLGREIEVKISTLSSSKDCTKTSLTLQTDWDSLIKKGSVDHIFHVTDVPFEKHFIVYVPNMTSDMFTPPSGQGARGRARVKKAEIFRNGYVFHGEMIPASLSRTNKKLEKVKSLLQKETDPRKCRKLEEKLNCYLDEITRIKGIDRQGWDEFSLVLHDEDGNP